MARQLRPRATDGLAVAPVTVTDRTCAAVLGLEPRVFRAWLMAANVPHAHIGRRVVARVDDVLAALRNAPAPTAAPEADDEDAVPTTADDVLAALGMRRSA